MRSRRSPTGAASTSSSTPSAGTGSPTRCAAWPARGRLLVIGFTEGSIPEVKVNRLLLNNTSVVGAGWGAFWLRDVDYLQEQWGEVRPLLEQGRLDPPIGATFPLEEAADALLELDERRARGKVLLRVR